MTRPVRLQSNNGTPEFSTLNSLQWPRDGQKSTATLQASITVLLRHTPNRTFKSKLRSRHINPSTSHLKPTSRTTIRPDIRSVRHFQSNIISIPKKRRGPKSRAIHRIRTQETFQLQASQLTKRSSPRVSLPSTNETRQPALPLKGHKR